MLKINKYLLAGAVATIPMTLVMSKLFNKLPAHEKYPLPPRIISMNLAHDAGVKKYMDEMDKLEMTMINHFGYGAVAGAVYYPLTEDVKIHPVVTGAGYGIAVWAFSYLGLLPALHLYPKIKDEPVERTGLMIFSHVVWGATLGLIKSGFFKSKDLKTT